MPTYKFLYGPPEADVQIECPANAISVTYPVTAEAHIEADDASALPYLKDFYQPRGWRYAGEVTP